tara:strand:+ start:1989 stop:2333 length:345 start_codon:yes stop_codon:yes gene_type:complete
VRERTIWRGSSLATRATRAELETERTSSVRHALGISIRVMASLAVRNDIRAFAGGGFRVLRACGDNLIQKEAAATERKIGPSSGHLFVVQPSSCQSQTFPDVVGRAGDEKSRAN